MTKVAAGSSEAFSVMYNIIAFCMGRGCVGLIHLSPMLNFASTKVVAGIFEAFSAVHSIIALCMGRLRTVDCLCLCVASITRCYMCAAPAAPVIVCCQTELSQRLAMHQITSFEAVRNEPGD